MSYEPTEWKTGDVVTAAKLNKLEDGVANAGGGGSGGGLVVHMVEDLEAETATLDKTWAEINAVVMNGGSVYLTFGMGDYYAIQSVFVNSGEYYYVMFVYPASPNQRLNCVANSPDEYPEVQMT